MDLNLLMGSKQGGKGSQISAESLAYGEVCIYIQDDPSCAEP